MTDWYKVRDSRAEKPDEYDALSSPTTVYQRRNIERVSVEDEQGAHEEWQYEQRDMTAQEYIAIIEAQSEQQRADIDYIAMETGVEL